MILGIDFLRKHRLVLGFTSIPIGVKSQSTQEVCQAPELELIWKASQKVWAKTRAVVSTRELTDESLDDCTVPLFYKSHTPTHELPLCPLLLLSSLLEEHKDLFRTAPGHTDINIWFPCKDTTQKNSCQLPNRGPEAAPGYAGGRNN